MRQAPIRGRSSSVDVKARSNIGQSAWTSGFQAPISLVNMSKDKDIPLQGVSGRPASSRSGGDCSGDARRPLSAGGRYPSGKPHPAFGGVVEGGSSA
jgi:hypothetical protein